MGKSTYYCKRLHYVGVISGLIESLNPNQFIVEIEPLWRRSVGSDEEIPGTDFHLIRVEESTDKKWEHIVESVRVMRISNLDLELNKAAQSIEEKGFEISHTTTFCKRGSTTVVHIIGKKEIR